jgi:hypothetical protein
MLGCLWGRISRANWLQEQEQEQEQEQAQAQDQGKCT